MESRPRARIQIMGRINMFLLGTGERPGTSLVETGKDKTRNKGRSGLLKSLEDAMPMPAWSKATLSQRDWVGQEGRPCERRTLNMSPQVVQRWPVSYAVISWILESSVLHKNTSEFCFPQRTAKEKRKRLNF